MQDNKKDTRSFERSYIINEEEHSFCSKEEQSLNLDKVWPLKTKLTIAEDYLQPHNFNYEPKSQSTTNTQIP